jgi:hypothetical protein
MEEIKMKILFVMPKVGAWATHGIHKSPNQLYAHWAAYVRERGYTDVAVIDGRALEIPMDELIELEICSAHQVQ